MVLEVALVPNKVLNRREPRHNPDKAPLLPKHIPALITKEDEAD